MKSPSRVRLSAREALRRSLSEVPDTLDAHEQALVALADGDETSAWRKGWHWAQIVDKRLWRQGPFQSPEDFFQKRLKIHLDRRTLELYASVARTFTEKAARYGMAKLDLLRQYRLAHGTTGSADDPGAEPISLPGKEPKTKPFADCTAAELRRALRASSAARPKPGKAPGSPLLDLVREMRMDWLGGDRSDVAAVMKNGKVMVSLGWFELEKIGPFCDAVNHVLDEWTKAGMPNGPTP